jgi:hypothetical protein
MFRDCFGWDIDKSDGRQQRGDFVLPRVGKLQPGDNLGCVFPQARGLTESGGGGQGQNVYKDLDAAFECFFKQFLFCRNQTILIQRRVESNR